MALHSAASGEASFLMLFAHQVELFPPLYVVKGVLPQSAVADHEE
ncbi:hypothetical protein [Anaplasma capra]|nr:hypothetical protein [Anaplasma capra]